VVSQGQITSSFLINKVVVSEVVMKMLYYSCLCLIVQFMNLVEAFWIRLYALALHCLDEDP
jgi:hypothetical protein